VNRSGLIDVLRRYGATLREIGATAVFIFGCRARGTEHADSDLDLFIDYDPAAKGSKPVSSHTDVILWQVIVTAAPALQMVMDAMPERHPDRTVSSNATYASWPRAFLT
jgi:predicted nucleotidyltransferase